MKLLTLIYFKTFFVWCTRFSEISSYRDDLEKNIFSSIEMGKMEYMSIMTMPVKRFLNYLKWKTELEENKKKMYEDYAHSMRGSI